MYRAELSESRPHTIPGFRDHQVKTARFYNKRLTSRAFKHTAAIMPGGVSVRDVDVSTLHFRDLG